MVGPFASLDEAEKAQRRLGGMGSAARGYSSTSRCAAHLAASSHRRSSAAIPAYCSSARPIACRSCSRCSRAASGHFVAAGRHDVPDRCRPDATPAQPQQWSAPEGVHLLHTVSIESLSAQGGLNYVRARVALPEFAKANVRTEGRRVYVDLTWPLDGEEGPRTPRPMTASSREQESRPQQARRARRETARRNKTARPRRSGIGRRSSRSISASARSVRSCFRLRSQDRRTSMRRSIRRSLRSKRRWSG